MPHQLIHGKMDGVVWFEAPIPDRGAFMTKPPEGVTTMIVLSTLLPEDWEVRNILANTGRTRYDSPGPFLPFDLEKAFPGRHVVYHASGFTDERITAWMKARGSVPDELDVGFRTIGYGEDGRMVAAATTTRNGRTVTVKRDLARDLPLPEAFEKEVPWLLAKCPRPSRDGTPHTCGEHVVRILEHLTPNGVARVRSWLEDLDAKPNDRRTLTLGSTLLPGTGISRLMLTMTRMNVVTAEIQVNGGHLLRDDASGVEVELAQPLPDTLVNGLKGTPLSTLIDVEWAQSLTVRMARAVPAGERKTTMRAGSPGAPLRLPVGVADKDPDVSLKEMVALGECEEGGWPTVTEVSAAALAPLRALNPTQFVDLVAMMRTEGSVDLGLFGQPGWRLRLRGSGIVVDDSPDVAWADFLRDATGTNPER